jgi:ribosomal protein S27AE
MKVSLDVFQTEVENDDGDTVEGIEMECPRCGHMVKVYGTHEGSLARGTAMMRDECPRGEKNRYEATW